MAKPFTVPPICRNCLNKEKCPADCSMRSLSGNENRFTLPNPGCHSVTAVDPVECFMKLARWNVWDYVLVECLPNRLLVRRTFWKPMTDKQARKRAWCLRSASFRHGNMSVVVETGELPVLRFTVDHDRSYKDMDQAFVARVLAYLSVEGAR